MLRTIDVFLQTQILKQYFCKRSKKMIIKIKSENQFLLDLLHKNPNTDNGLYLKTHKNGVLVGMALNPNEYHVLFQDTKYSYLPEDSNQVDYQSYCSPLLVLHICNEYFSQVLKEKTTYYNETISWLNKTKLEIDNLNCEIEVPSFYIYSNWYRNGQFLLSKYFKNIEVEHQVGRVFSLKITGSNLFEAMNLLSLVSVFTHITNEYGIHTFIDDEFAIKYNRILTNISNVPYFVFYLFIKRAVKSDRQFQTLKPQMENYLAAHGLDANLTYYDTHVNRILFVTNLLDESHSVLDFGCGEFKYFKKVNKATFKKSYYAIDIDDSFRVLFSKLKAESKKENFYFYNQLNEYPNDEKVNVILSEVIEHNTIEEAKNVIKNLMKLNYHQIIITTPNSEFNQHYQLEDEMRHDDHEFEFDANEFKNFIIETTKDFQNFTLDFYGIGDSLNGVQPTQAVVIKNTSI